MKLPNFKMKDFEKDFLVEIIISKQLTKTLKSGTEVAKLQNEGFAKGLTRKKKKNASTVGKRFEIWP